MAAFSFSITGLRPNELESSNSILSVDRSSGSTKRIPPESFFTRYRGSKQRPPSGSRLVCDADNGHVFEVTLGGEVIWGFWNTELDGTSRKRIYRLMRISRQDVRDRFRQKTPVDSVSR